MDVTADQIASTLHILATTPDRILKEPETYPNHGKIASKKALR